MKTTTEDVVRGDEQAGPAVHMPRGARRACGARGGQLAAAGDLAAVTCRKCRHTVVYRQAVANAAGSAGTTREAAADALPVVMADAGRVLAPALRSGADARQVPATLPTAGAELEAVRTEVQAAWDCLPRARSFASQHREAVRNTRHHLRVLRGHLDAGGPALPMARQECAEAVRHLPALASLPAGDVAAAVAGARERLLCAGELLSTLLRGLPRYACAVFDCDFTCTALDDLAQHEIDRGHPNLPEAAAELGAALAGQCDCGRARVKCRGPFSLIRPTWAGCQLCAELPGDCRCILLPACEQCGRVDVARERGTAGVHCAACAAGKGMPVLERGTYQASTTAEGLVLDLSLPEEVVRRVVCRCLRAVVDVDGAQVCTGCNVRPADCACASVVHVGLPFRSVRERLGEVSPREAAAVARIVAEDLTAAVQVVTDGPVPAPDGGLRCGKGACDVTAADVEALTAHDLVAHLPATLCECGRPLVPGETPATLHTVVCRHCERTRDACTCMGAWHVLGQADAQVRAALALVGVTHQCATCGEPFTEPTAAAAHAPGQAHDVLELRAVRLAFALAERHAAAVTDPAAPVMQWRCAHCGLEFARHEEGATHCTRSGHGTLESIPARVAMYCIDCKAPLTAPDGAGSHFTFCKRYVPSAPPAPARWRCVDCRNVYGELDGREHAQQHGHALEDAHARPHAGWDVHPPALAFCTGCEFWTLERPRVALHHETTGHTLLTPAAARQRLGAPPFPTEPVGLGHKLTTAVLALALAQKCLTGASKAVQELAAVPEAFASAAEDLAGRAMEAGRMRGDTMRLLVAFSDAGRVTAPPEGDAPEVGAPVDLLCNRCGWRGFLPRPAARELPTTCPNCEAAALVAAETAGV